VKNPKVFAESLKTKWFPKEEDKVWKKWVDYKRREKRDLVDLLSTEVKDGFKKRALFLLIVPSADFNPVYWKEEVGMFNRSDFLKNLSPELLNCAVELVIEFCKALSPLHDDRTKYITEGGPGITITVPVPDKYHDALYFYNDCILTLLSLVFLPEQAEKIFPLFSLRDISTYEGMEEVSGYHPFQKLLYSKEISESWKKAADDAMREVVLNELNGKTKPREKWEEAWEWYANIINSQLYGGKPTYSLKLLADQINFLLCHRRSNKKLVNAHNVLKMFKLFSNERCKYLRHQVSRFVVLESKDRFESFFVYDEETLQAANQMLEEFGDSDPELAKKVRSLIKKAEKRDAEEVNEEAKEKNAEENILTQMK